VAGKESRDSQGRSASEIDCWVTPDSQRGSRNPDGVQVAAEVGAGTQTISLNDIVSTTASGDKIDLICNVPSGDGTATVTDASLIAWQVTNVNASG
jgi:hypothetical protein